MIFIKISVQFRAPSGFPPCLSIGQQGGNPEWGYLVSLFYLRKYSRAAENFEDFRHKSTKSLRKLISDVKTPTKFRLRRAMIQNIDYDVYFVEQNQSYFSKETPPPPKKTPLFRSFF